MATPVRITLVDRRDLVLGGSAAAALAGWLAIVTRGSPSAAQTATPAATPAATPGGPASAGTAWLDSYRKVIGDAKPIEGRITLELPPLAENGNTVPFSVSVESPMTDGDYVKAIHVFATANPVPAIATFHLTPQSGSAIVASRMRLAQTQDVIALAALSDGRFLIAKRSINVAIGGCGG